MQEGIKIPFSKPSLGHREEVAIKRVRVSPLTFVASVSPAIYCEAEIQFVDTIVVALYPDLNDESIYYVCQAKRYIGDNY